jgi:hypothetical protein
MFLGGYLGVGLVLVAQAAEGDLRQIPLLLAFFLISGLRLAFDLPASAVANWAFQFSANNIAPSPNAVARRLTMLLVLPWQLLPVGSFATVLLNLAFALLGIDLVFLNFQRIPFTYRVQPDSRKMVMRFVLALLGFLMLAPFLAWLEKWATAQWWHYAIVSAGIAAGWLDLRRRRTANERDLEILSFEEIAPSEFQLLKLA